MPIIVPEIETERLRLRPLTQADAPEIVRLVNDFEVARYTATIPYPYDMKMALDFIATPEAAPEAASRFIDDPEGAIVLAIALKEGDRLLGCVGLQKTPEGPELGYWIGREYWRRGYASEAAGRLVRLAFENFALPELIASAVTVNDASHRVLEKIGFVICGKGEIHSRAQNSDLPVIHRRLRRNDWLRATGRAA
ncbi:GNAT family N-acetyltransferase [Dongia sp.]|uniref:GNAT family N-acetyltransferase n=1 Tax=Dongia sp. TaxID=1977262 RepID=UPI0035B2853C